MYKKRTEYRKQILFQVLHIGFIKQRNVFICTRKYYIGWATKTNCFGNLLYTTVKSTRYLNTLHFIPRLIVFHVLILSNLFLLELGVNKHVIIHIHM